MESSTEPTLGDLSLNDELTSKKGQKKLAAQLEKERRKQIVQARLDAEKEARQLSDFAASNYGHYPLNQSQERTSRQWTRIGEINEAFEGQTVLVRGRLYNSRGTGKQVFLILREGFSTMQMIAAVDDVYVSKEMVKFGINIPKESVVDIKGTVVKAKQQIESCSQHWYEIHLHKMFIVSESKHRLPISIEDASRSEESLSSEQDTFVHVNLDTRLDNRVIDLRTLTNQAIFSISSGVNAILREYFMKHGFIEIHTPKFQAAASEGGASVFKVGYFKGEAYLAQSPQFFKQMAICADMNRVFEIAPVFRAENSFTHRHMTEYVSVDCEMAFHEHYHEVLEFIGDMFVFLFDELKGRYAKELDMVRHQYPFVDIVYPRKSLILMYSEGIQMLRGAGVEIGDYDDISTPQEKLLGKLVKEKYGTDFYILDKFPLSVRPFYTMPDPMNPQSSNSYDFFIRGEEVLSGAQRVHDYDLLLERVCAHGVDPVTVQTYLDAFKYGVPPHAGAGIGLERVVMLYLALGNIRKTSLFPRDPKRLSP